MGVVTGAMNPASRLRLRSPLPKIVAPPNPRGVKGYLVENRSLGPGMAGRGVCGLAAVWVFWAGSLSPVCRDGPHDDDDYDDEVF